MRAYALSVQTNPQRRIAGADLPQTKEHAEVTGADGVHVGTVDHVDGDRIKLTRKDEAHGQSKDHHHYLPLAGVASVDGGKLCLSANAANAGQLHQENDQSGPGSVFVLKIQL